MASIVKRLASEGAHVALTYVSKPDQANETVKAAEAFGGPVDTDLNPATGEFAKMLIQQMAPPRYGTGDEIASLVAYLASPEAAYVIGASLTIDGGFTA